MKCIRLLAAILSILALLPLASCTDEPMVKSYFEYFDTVCAVYSYADETKEQFEENCRMIEEVFEKYDKELDIYYEYSGINNLRTINKKAAKEPVPVSAELIDFLVYAKKIYTLTETKTNIAMGAVLSLWHDARETAEDEPLKAYVPS